MKATHTLAIAGLTLVVGCSSFRRDVGANDEDRIGVNWGYTDLQTMAEAQVDDLMKAPGLSYLEHPGKGDDKRIVVYMGRIANETHEHINMRSLSDKMMAAMVSTGKFRFVVSEPGQDEVAEQVRFQQGAGRVAEEQAKAFGKQLGADAVVFGTLYDIRKRTGRTLESGGTKKADNYYQLVMKCVNIETAEVLWAHEEEMHKQMIIGFFGR